MKLRARFPQIGLGRVEPVASSQPERRKPRGGSAAKAEPAAVPAARIADAGVAPVMTSEFAPPVDWPSTVAAWRSTTGKAE